MNGVNFIRVQSGGGRYPLSKDPNQRSNIPSVSPTIGENEKKQPSIPRVSLTIKKNEKSPKGDVGLYPERPLPKGVFVTELPDGSLKVRQEYNICNPGD